MTRYIGVIGYPLRHSVSPAFQQAALDYCGLDLRYEVWEVKRAAEGISRLRQPNALGANVTVPHKEAVLPFLDSIDTEARHIGAVNTIVKENGKLKGYNTDAAGFLRALRERAGFEPAGKVAVVLGAGGAARAVAFAIVTAGVKSLTIFNRTPDRAERLAQELGRPVVARPWKGDIDLSGSDLVVNATSIGMEHGGAEALSPLPAKLIPPQALVFDLVYNPVETPLMKEAQKAGARTLGGLAMLVYQGALSFELWTGRQAPLDIMFEAAKGALVEEKIGMEKTEQLRECLDAICKLAQEVGLRAGFTVEVKPKKTAGLVSLWAAGKHFAHASCMKSGAIIGISTKGEWARRAGVIESADSVKKGGYYGGDDEARWRLGASDSDRVKDMVSILVKVCRARHQ